MQNLSNGETLLVEAPAPEAERGTVVIATTRSLISSGTERMLVGFGRASLLEKARQQPDKVRQVLDKVRTDGLATTVSAVRAKLDQPIPLGYCNVGRIIDVGAGVNELAAGDRVVSNGSHADLVKVPRMLTAKIPDNVTDDQAAFVVVASIGLQGIRLAQPTLGERFVVIGAGLIGLLTIQMLLAQGCRVLAIDFDPAKLALAESYGAATCLITESTDPVAEGMAFSNGIGVDAVIITASTDSDEPVTNAARMSRKRGRIVLVGVSGLKLNRSDFYEKELSFQVSCSYGPGRYDKQYEENGNDYPLAFVRWTEQRNFEAVLDMLASGRLRVDDLISQRFKFDDAEKAYAALASDKKGLGLLLEYDTPVEERTARVISFANQNGGGRPGAAAVGCIGAGNYASRMLIPAFRKAGAKLHTLASAGGVSSALQSEKLGFSRATTDNQRIFADGEIDVVAVVTRHDSHARLAAQALRAGKSVFVEKPLALTLDELGDVRDAFGAAQAVGGSRQLMVGFNRRFAPQVQTMKRLIEPVKEPKTFIMVMNAGAIPADHWTQNPAIGGGRIVGEACHHIDLMRFLVGHEITGVKASRIGGTALAVLEDKATITLEFADGSMGSIHYFANGGANFPKERIECFVAGRTLQIDNFRRMTGFNWPGFRKQNMMRQDKGQNACVAAFLAGLQTGVAAIPIDEIFEVAHHTIIAAQQLRGA
jgi:predicted dehydrogenase